MKIQKSVHCCPLTSFEIIDAYCKNLKITFKLNIFYVLQSESTNNGDADEIGRDENDSKKTHPLTALEVSSRGVVPGNLTVNYFNSGISTCVMGFMLALFIITQVIVCFNDYFMQEL